MDFSKERFALYGMPGHLIRRLQQMAAAVFFDELGAAGIDLTPVQYAALKAVQHYPNIDQATLAGVIAYDRTTIGGVIDRLESKGLVRRTLSPEDRRVRRLVLQPKGAALLDDVEPLVKRVQSRITAPLSSDEKASLMHCMTKLLVSHNDVSRAPLRPIASPPPSPSRRNKRSDRQEP